MSENSPFLIGITGGSGSGKTSIIKEIRKAFSESQLCLISQDDYYHPREKQLTDEQGVKNFDLPTSIDLDGMKSDIAQLSQGHIVEREEYTFNNKLKTPETKTFYPAPVILVEGLFIFVDADLFHQFDLSVYVHAKENLKVIRRIKRDQVERNYPIDDVLYRYQNHVLPSFEKYIAPFREEADLVINNNHHFSRGVEALKGIIRSQLM